MTALRLRLGVDGEARQQRSQPPPGDLDRRTVIRDDLHWAEQADAHAACVSRRA